MSAQAQTRSIPSREDETVSTTISTPSTQIPTTTRATPHPRWLLQIKARISRFLARIGLYLYSLPALAPKPPSFARQSSTTVISAVGATLELAFYVPEGYNGQIKQGKRYPMVFNFQGGGFTLGMAKDDERWAATVIGNVDAVLVSVEYRLAPEFPFPTAVEDGVEALLHLASNAEEFGIDPSRMVMSGFSAGGNLCFAIPLRLQTHLESIKNDAASKSITTPQLPQVVAIIAWYPNVDNRLTPDERRASCVGPDKPLPPILTNLFDESYMLNLQDKLSSYASPAAATDEALKTALPESIVMYLCEWDRLLQEGEVFAKRLKELEKSVHCTIIEGKRHGSGKSPNPFSVDPEILKYYTEACGMLREAFGQSYRCVAYSITNTGLWGQCRIFSVHE